ncbi:uncharacterized protein LOC131637885 [Vicia villosa]|uniref:uncharacterized protein LOC131637885 n=1 Tax=Vicia villosa TaxID=3911 RepID=UPI00273AFA16|nr:uncharacterized protein LOC131637885 [Vicia villosa]
MLEIGMPREFTRWILTVVTNVSYEFNINGHTIERMMAKRGLRQGDPISPLPFVLMMEYFDRLMVKMQDTLILSITLDARRQSLLWRDAKDTISQVSDFAKGKLPMKYLGVPITCKRLTINQYMPLIEKTIHRLKHCTVKLLRYSGRIMLVKSVILAIAQYWMQCMPLPQTVIDKIDRLCRTFIWTGNTEVSKKSLVAWSNVCRPKSQGGQGIINLTKWNKITMLKCLWNLCRKSDNLWVKWIHIVYLKGRNAMDAMVSKSRTWVLNRILDMREVAQQHLTLWNRMKNQSKFKMSMFYMAMCEAREIVEWIFLFHQNATRPRAQFITWLICHGKQATKDILLRFNMIDDSICSI